MVVRGGSDTSRHGTLSEIHPAGVRELRIFKEFGRRLSILIVRVGNSVKTWVNGVPVADLVDKKSKMPKGFIGLQVHGIRKGTGPYEVRWRHIFLKDLAN